jgi:hypothetical protein
MSELSSFCNEISLLPLEGSAIFATSKKQNACHPSVYESVITTISNNIDCNGTLKCIDFFCGHGMISYQIKKTFNSEVIGVDINEFNEWNDFTDVNFFQRDVFEVIKLEPTFKFDIVVTFNTLRAESKMWGEEKYNSFLDWCSKHTNYIITNRCTDKEFDDFELIDIIQIPNFFDTNLFKRK